MREYFLDPSKESDALFLSKYKRRISGISIRRMIHRRKDEAGVSSRGTIHAFRHSFASHILKHGANIEAIGRILGHESLETTKRYAHISNDDLIKVYKDSHPRALCRAKSRQGR